MPILFHQRTRSVSRHARTSRARRLGLESLEDRQLLTTISVGNASMNEVADASAFVAPGSGGLSSPKDIARGPDGNLYVASSATNSVLRYNAATGALIGTFVAANSGGLVNPFGIAFGPDGNLYVGGAAGSNAIYRYNGTTGAYLSTFVPAGSGGLSTPTGIGFGPDGNLYVSSRDTDSILRYQGPSGPSPGSPLHSAGQPGATFVAPGSGGLDNPFELAFGPGGDLYVAGTLTNRGVLRFSGTDGGFLATVVTPGEGGLGEPRGLAFDQDGRIYVADVSTNAVHRYDSLGQYLDDPVGTTGTTVRGPIGIAFDAQGALLISSRDTNAIVRYDRGVAVTISAASPMPVSVNYQTVDGTATAGADYSAQAGTVTFAPGQTSRRILLATLDDLLVEGDETFGVQLSNATGGATIANGSANVTVVDDDSTRRFSVGDASAVEGDHAAHYRGAFVNGPVGSQFLGLTFGPDGALYSSLGPTTAGPIVRYDGTTGASLGTFIPGGRVNGVRDKVFQGGFLYIGSEYTDEVLRFDATTGAFDRAFVTAGSGGIDGPHGLTFGPDTNGDGVPELYVTGRNSFNVVRYDGVTGLTLGAFNTSGSGALSWPEGMTIGPDGVAYVASTGTNQIQKYNPVTGAYLGAVTSSNLVGPKDVKFGPDGLMYVASSGNDRILRFTSSGSYLDDFVPAASGGLDDPHRLAFGPDGDLYVGALGSSQILRFGTESEALFTVSLSTSSPMPLTVSFATANSSATAGSDYTATSGTLTFEPGVTSKLIRVPTLNDAVGEPTETFTVNLSSPVGGFIADGQGGGTIFDDDATKFYVVNDASSDRTYEYGAGGNSIESYAVNSGNTAPRGAASTAAGDKVWVVDANKKVYVYNASGGLLGSWTAGSLASNATVEGIATNGTDVWIVDARQDKVFRYAGAAGRLTGSQNAASSFNLNSGNTNPKDVVTDGTYLWVVDLGFSTDKVFKYTLSGTLVGSWALGYASVSPTGITIDPANVSNVWIVDAGTGRVYQFDGAAGRTSGSQAPSASFTLAAGNTNPQGIADPPVPSLSTSHPTATRGTTFPNLPASTRSSERLMPAVAPASFVARQEPPNLVPLAPPGDQDMTLLATELIRTGTRRTRTSTRS